ncbi:MAG: TIGR02391 family protein, partial [Chloroflexi bacterium]|nr:TIGR02391 family protein [Chloroflexota bacterium]
FHAVFEAAKAFNARVKEKSGIWDLDGQPLMNKVFSAQSPIIKVSPCRTDTEKNIQDGYRSLAAGLMAAIRNPTAHEPALSFPIGREEALEVLSLISYLFRCLEKAVPQKE